MKVRGMFAPALAVGLLFGGVSASQAQYFNFTDTIVPLTQTGTGGATAGGGASTTTFTVTPAADGSGVNGGAPFGSNIIVANFSNIISNAADLTPDFFTPAANTYNLSLTITPSTPAGAATAAGISHTFTGAFNGSASSSASNVNNGGFGFTSVVYDFGGGLTYTVTPQSFTGPQSPGSANLGSLQYHVVSSVAAVPEPSSIAMLIGMGVSGSAFMLRRRAVK